MGPRTYAFLAGLCGGMAWVHLVFGNEFEMLAGIAGVFAGLVLASSKAKRRSPPAESSVQNSVPLYAGEEAENEDRADPIDWDLELEVFEAVNDLTSRRDDENRETMDKLWKAYCRMEEDRDRWQREAVELYGRK